MMETNFYAGLRAAIYARLSDDKLGRESSIEDQTRNCRRAADHFGWKIQEEYNKFDSGICGAMFESRTGLMELLHAAKRNPRPFDVVVIDDTSRFGRILELVLKAQRLFARSGVFLYFVAQHLDTRDETSKLSLVFHGYKDESYVTDLSKKVHRGLEGLAIRGRATGGRCYGYKNVPIEDPTQKGEYGRAKVLYVDPQIDEEGEARGVRRIFDLYGAGNSPGQIITILNKEGFPPPQPRENNPDPRWTLSTLRCMLENERYRGRFVWNRTQGFFDQDTEKTFFAPRPKSEWVVRDFPEKAIVTEEQWQRVINQREKMRRKFNPQQLGGMGRVPNDHLFSGLLICGECGNPMCIIRPNTYGCRRYRQRDERPDGRRVCTNSLTIRVDRLEHQLLSIIVQKTLAPEMLEYATAQFQSKLEAEISRMTRERAKIETRQPDLRASLVKKRSGAKNVGEAIAVLGVYNSPTLLAQLKGLETEIAALESQLKMVRQPEKIDVGDIKGFVLSWGKDLTSILMGDKKIAKQAIQSYFEPLKLIPVERGNKRFYNIEGFMKPFFHERPVMLLAAPQGFEPRYAAPEAAVLPLNEGASSTIVAT
jgi:site-specific DNA recombinase